MFGIRGKEDRVNIVEKDLLRSFDILGESVEIELKGVKFAKTEKEEVVLDKINVEERIEKVAKALQVTATKYNSLPEKVVIYNKDNMDESRKSKEEEAKDNQLVNLCEPSWTLDSIYISEKEKETIINALAMAKYKDKLFNEWGIRGNNNSGRAVCLNFWGPPGTGKSITAEAIADYLDRKLLIVNYSELESKYVGETPKNIKRIFKLGEENNAVIVFDEADSFLGKRLTNVTQSADYGVNITRSVMLMELENFDGVIIFTTNLLNNYDQAFKRRILANIEFKLPDKEGRKAIWSAHLSPNIPIDAQLSADILGEHFDKISGADIGDMLLLAATRVLREGKDLIQLEDFEYAYDIVRGRYSQDMDNISYIKTERISEEQYEDEIVRSKANN